MSAGSTIPRSQRTCTLCNTNSVEDEYHLLTCPTYQYITVLSNWRSLVRRVLKTPLSSPKIVVEWPRARRARVLKPEPPPPPSRGPMGPPEGAKMDGKTPRGSGDGSWKAVPKNAYGSTNPFQASWLLGRDRWLVDEGTESCGANSSGLRYVVSCKGCHGEVA